MRRVPGSPGAWIAALALVLALLLPGMRGLWDPDEGRYTNVALHMVESGDWVSPHRSEEIGHWTKPPLAYWAIAAGVSTFGHDPWAARLPSTLSYLLCIWLAFRIGRRLAPGHERMAALAFAMMFVPFGAAQWISTDYVLTACETLAMWGFVEARFGSGRHPRRWLALMWAGFGLAFLAKGPPALLPLLAVFAFDALTPATMPGGGRRPRALQWWGPLLFAAIALPWYAVVVARTPGLLDYFLGAEVVDRIASNRHGRQGGWFGWLQVYAPTLLLGTLPWTATLWRWLRGLRERLRGWRTPGDRAGDPANLLLALWFALPMLVFCFAQSRMPLYVLPLFVPLAVLVARQRGSEGRGLPPWRATLAWAALLLALQVATAFWPTHKDGDAWRQAIEQRTDAPISRVVFVDDIPRYSLHLELGAPVTKLSSSPAEAPPRRFGPEYDGDIRQALGPALDPHALWITPQPHYEEVRTRLQTLGYTPVPQGTPYEDRTLFRVHPITN